MCVILVCPPKVRPSDTVLRACHDANPHGAGVAWREGDRIHWRKNLRIGHVDQLIREIKGEVVIHFRWASVGGVDARLCHPFPVRRTAGLGLEGKAKAVLFHNGTWSDWEAGLQELVELGGYDDINGPMSDTRAAALLVHGYGARVLDTLPGRWVLMDARRTVLRGAWDDFRGMKVSNTNFVHRLPQRPRSSGEPRRASFRNHYPQSADTRAHKRHESCGTGTGQMSLGFSSTKPLT